MKKNTVTTPMPPADIVLLVGLMRQVFAFQLSLRLQHDIARHIQYVKTPTRLSESIVCHAITAGELLPNIGEIKMVSLGRTICDVLVQLEDSTFKHVEVKGTGIEGFTTITDKDVHADFLIWLDYSDCFSAKASNTITTWVLERQPVGVKLTGNLADFKKIPNVKRFDIDIGSLKVSERKLGVMPDIFAEDDYKTN